MTSILCLRLISCLEGYAIFLFGVISPNGLTTASFILDGVLQPELYTKNESLGVFIFNELVFSQSLISWPGTGPNGSHNLTVIPTGGFNFDYVEYSYVGSVSFETFIPIHGVQNR